VHRILWRLPNTCRELRVPTMKGETMKETMEREKAEAIATLKRANRALERIFNLEEECVDCGRPLSECEADEADCEQMSE